MSFELSAHELNVLYTFLMNKMEVEPQPSCSLTLSRSFVFLSEILPNKTDILDFLDKETRQPVWKSLS